MSGERSQELDFLLRGAVLLRPVNPDRADGRHGPDRRHDEAFNECRAVGVVRDARVEVDVLDGGRLVIQHCPAADARFQRETLTFPQGPDRIFLGVITQLAVLQHEARAVGVHQCARFVADDLHDRGEIACERQPLDHANELLHPLPGTTSRGRRGGNSIAS